MINSIIQALFKIKIQPNTSEQEQKGQRIYYLINAETKPKFLCLTYTKQRNIFTQEKSLRERRSGGLNKKRKEGF